MQQRPGHLTNLCNFRNRLYDAGLVIDKHDRHKERLSVYSLTQCRKVNDTVASNTDGDDLKSIFRKRRDRVQNRSVLSRLRHNALPSPPCGSCDTQDGEIVRLRGTRREYKVFCFGADGSSYILACGFRYASRVQRPNISVGVRIPKMVRKKRRHCLQNPGVHGRCRLMI